MKRLPGLREIYHGVRKPVAPPTRVERDRREGIRKKADMKEMKRHKGKREDGG
jgi:hypothetical protein